MKKEQLHTNFPYCPKLAEKQTGFSLVEVILATSLFALLVTIIIGSYLYGQESTMLAGNRAQAVLLSEEGLEAVRNIRDEDFAIITDGIYGLAVSGNQWNLSGSSDTNGIFTRQIEISSIDNDRKEIISVVTWQQNAQRKGLVSATSYLTNWQELIDTPLDCTGPPQDRPPECKKNEVTPPDCTGPPRDRPPECN